MHTKTTSRRGALKCRISVPHEPKLDTENWLCKRRETIHSLIFRAATERTRRGSSSMRSDVERSKRMQWMSIQHDALICRAAAAPTRRGTSGPGEQANMFWFFNKVRT